MFPMVPAPFYISASNMWRFWFLYILSRTYCLFKTVILVGVKWYFTVVLICISLMANDVEHLFIFLLAIFISFLEKCLYKCFCHFLIWLFVFLLLSCKSFSYILDKSPLLNIWLTNIFPILWFVFLLSWWGPLRTQSLFYFHEFQFLYLF